MQFTILGTSVTVIRNRKPVKTQPDPLVHKVRTPEEMLELTRKEALKLQALGDTRIFY